MPAKSTSGSMTLAKQICEQIPGHVVPKLARKYGIDTWDNHVQGKPHSECGTRKLCKAKSEIGGQNDVEP